MSSALATSTPLSAASLGTTSEKRKVKTLLFIDTYGNGLIFTGMEDGSFLLWNPQDMVATYQPDAILSAEGL